MQGQAPPARVAAPPNRPVPPPRVVAGARLPVRRVVLYKSGVGYFEHLGRVSGAQTVSIDLTSGQLDDVLKSLTTVDLGGGQVTGITYNTEAPLEEQLRKLRLPLGADVSRTAAAGGAAWRAGRGAGGGAIVAGRILSVVAQVRGKDETRRTVDELTIVGEGGDDPHLRPGARRRRDDGRGRPAPRPRAVPRRDRRGARRRTSGGCRSRHAAPASRELFVSYVSEVPVWKTTYRLVIPTESGTQAVHPGLGHRRQHARRGLDRRRAVARRRGAAVVHPAAFDSRSTPSGRWCRSRPARVVAPEIHGGAMTAGPASLSRDAWPTRRAVTCQAPT